MCHHPQLVGVNVANETSLARTVWRDASQGHYTKLLLASKGGQGYRAGESKRPRKVRGLRLKMGSRTDVVKDQMLLPISGLGVE